MKQAVSVASTALQFFYLIGLFAFLYSVVLIFLSGDAYSSGDPKMVAGHISQALITLALRAGIGLVGVVLAWYSLRVNTPAPDWFVKISRSFAFAWLVFVPIGTIVGILMFRWIKRK